MYLYPILQMFKYGQTILNWMIYVAYMMKYNSFFGTRFYKE